MADVFTFTLFILEIQRMFLSIFVHCSYVAASQDTFASLQLKVIILCFPRRYHMPDIKSAV